MPAVARIRLIWQNWRQIFRCRCSLRTHRPESDASYFQAAPVMKADQEKGALSHEAGGGWGRLRVFSDGVSDGPTGTADGWQVLRIINTRMINAWRAGTDLLIAVAPILSVSGTTLHWTTANGATQYEVTVHTIDPRTSLASKFLRGTFWEAHRLNCRIVRTDSFKPGFAPSGMKLELSILLAGTIS